MPSIECDNGKWKWGENGACVYNSQAEAESDNEDYMEEDRDMTSLNTSAYDNAVNLIKSGKYNIDSDWDFTAADGNKLLGADGDNWSDYKKWFLAYDNDAEEETKGRYGYPFGKNDEVYRKALIAIRQYSGRFNLDAIFEAAGKLIDMIDERENSYRNIEHRHIVSIKEDEKTVTIVYEKDLDEDEESEEYVSFEKEPTEIDEEIRKENIKIWEQKYNNIDMEKRIFNLESRIEKREDGKEVVTGHASVYNSRSENLGGFYEYIQEGVFTDELIKKSDVRALINHDPNLVLARSKNGTGTLKLTPDTKGLAFEYEMPDLSYAKDLAINLRNGNITQSSFAFVISTDEWSSDDDGNDIRTITGIEQLYDISSVTYPAYSQAESDLIVAQRGLTLYKEQKENQRQENDLVKRSLLKLKIELKKR